MSVEEKVGQLLMVHFTGEIVNADAETLIEKGHVVGFQHSNIFQGMGMLKSILTSIFLLLINRRRILNKSNFSPFKNYFLLPTVL